MNDDLVLLLKAMLDTSTINAEAKKIQEKLNEDGIELNVKFNKSKYEQLAKELQAILPDLNKKFNGITVNELVESLKQAVKEQEKLVREQQTYVSATQQVNLTNRIQKWLSNNTRATKEARESMQLYLNELNAGPVTKSRLTEIRNEVTRLDTEMRSMGKLGKSFTHTFTEGMKKFSYWTSSTFVIMKTVSEIKQAVSTVKELDTALVDLRKTADMSSSQLEDFYYSANETAKQMGVTTKQIIEQAAAWSRLNKIGLLYGNI